MEDFERIDSVKDYNDFSGVETLHPLVSAINFNELSSVRSYRRYMGIYAIFLKEAKCGDIRQAINLMITRMGRLFCCAWTIVRGR